MLTVELATKEKVYVIMLSTPLVDVCGIVQCARCGMTQPIKSVGTDDVSASIELFARNHACPLSMEDSLKNTSAVPRKKPAKSAGK